MVPLDRPIGSDIPRFDNFDFINSMTVHAQTYLITNSFGDRQAVGRSYADFVLEFCCYPMKKSAKRHVTHSLQLGELTAYLLANQL